jgi:hypothetical protein
MLIALNLHIPFIAIYYKNRILNAKNSVGIVVLEVGA